MRVELADFMVNELIAALRNVPNSLEEISSLPPKFQKNILQSLNPSETTVAVYSDNLINDPDKWDDVKSSIDASVRGRATGCPAPKLCTIFQ